MSHLVASAFNTDEKTTTCARNIATLHSARFLDDGRIELDNNPAERAIRPVALGRKNHLFAGSDDRLPHSFLSRQITSLGVENRLWPVDELVERDSN